MCSELRKFVFREYALAKAIQVGMCVYIANIALRMSIGIYVVVIYNEYIKSGITTKANYPSLSIR